MRRAAEEKIPVSVAHRGVKPEALAGPELRESLRADNVVISPKPGARLTQKDVDQTDHVIVIGEAAKSPDAAKVEIWSVPSLVTDYDYSLVYIMLHINALLSAHRTEGPSRRC